MKKYGLKVFILKSTLKVKSSSTDGCMKPHINYTQVPNFIHEPSHEATKLFVQNGQIMSLASGLGDLI